MDTINWTDLIQQLSEPFPASTVFWRAGTVSRDKKRAQALPYAEPRVYEDRLNTVCPGGWAVRFVPWGENRIICELTIYGLTRSSTGEENDGFAPGTAAEAQAFKRACSKFGLGRYLYDIPISWVDYDGEKGRLVETPTLGEKFMPSASPVVPALSIDRAEAMGKELEKLGFARKEQLKLATSILGQPVRALTQLSETEALEVWAGAKRLSKSVA